MRTLPVSAPSTSTSTSTSASTTSGPIHPRTYLDVVHIHGDDGMHTQHRPHHDQQHQRPTTNDLRPTTYAPLRRRIGLRVRTLPHIPAGGACQGLPGFAPWQWGFRTSILDGSLPSSFGHCAPTTRHCRRGTWNMERGTWNMERGIWNPRTITGCKRMYISFRLL